MSRVHSMFALSCLLATGLFALVGCTQAPEKKDKQETQQAEAKNHDHDHDKKAGGEDGHSLHGYWCAEHGVPEEMCSLCSAEVAEKLKAKGDWCEIHDRAKSQCFKCDPSKYDRFAAMYRAKFGEEPPRPPESEFQK